MFAKQQGSVPASLEDVFLKTFEINNAHVQTKGNNNSSFFGFLHFFPSKMYAIKGDAHN